MRLERGSLRFVGKAIRELRVKNEELRIGERIGRYEKIERNGRNEITI